MHGNVDTYQQHLIRYVWALEFVPNKRVVDAACGTGYGSFLLASLAQFVYGIDISDEALSYAQSRYLLSNLSFYKEDLNSPRYFPQVEVLITFETIEHLEAPYSFLSSFLRTVPEVVGSIPIECPTPFHRHNYTVPQAIEFLKSFPFKKLELYHQDNFSISPLSRPYPHSGMLLFRGRVT